MTELVEVWWDTLRIPLVLLALAAWNGGATLARPSVGLQATAAATAEAKHDGAAAYRRCRGRSMSRADPSGRMPPPLVTGR